MQNRRRELFRRTYICLSLFTVRRGKPRLYHKIIGGNKRGFCPVLAGQNPATTRASKLAGRSEYPAWQRATLVRSLPTIP
jgi:hypothetical protein